MDQIYTLGLLLNRAAIAISKTATNRLSDMGYDLPHSQFVVLRAIHFKGAMSQYELAVLLSKDAAAIKRTVDNLEDKGLVKRQRISPKKFAVIITEKGKEIILKANAIVDSIIERALMGLSDQAKESLYTSLKNIHNNLDSLIAYRPII